MDAEATTEVVYFGLAKSDMSLAEKKLLLRGKFLWVLRLQPRSLIMVRPSLI